MVLSTIINQIYAFSACLPLFAFIICAYAVCLANAGNHYCPRGYQLEIDVTVRTYQDERIIGGLIEDSETEESEEEADQSVREPLRCIWLIKVNHLTASRQLVLEGVPKDNREIPGSTGNKTIQYQLQTPDKQANCSKSNNTFNIEDVSLGLFRVVPMFSRDAYLSVSFDWKDSQSASPVVLRALMPQAGYCSRDMLSFNGSCYAIIPVLENITMAAKNIRGDAQLASFTSLAQIEGFIAANNARLAVYPYSRPLDLIQPVRIGIFYRASDDKVLTVTRKNGRCPELIQVDIEQELRSATRTSVCAFLGVNATHQPVVEFGNCSQEMPTLVSFREIPGCREEFCEREIPEIIDEIFNDMKTEARGRSTNTELKYQLLFIVSTCVILTTMTVILMTVMLCQYRRRNHKGRFTPKSVSSTEDGNMKRNHEEMEIMERIQVYDVDDNRTSLITIKTDGVEKEAI